MQETEVRDGIRSPDSQNATVRCETFTSSPNFSWESFISFLMSAILSENVINTTPWAKV